MIAAWKQVATSRDWGHLPAEGWGSMITVRFLLAVIMHVLEALTSNSVVIMHFR